MIAHTHVTDVVAHLVHATGMNIVSLYWLEFRLKNMGWRCVPWKARCKSYTRTSCSSVGGVQRWSIGDSSELFCIQVVLTDPVCHLLVNTLRAMCSLAARLSHMRLHSSCRDWRRHTHTLQGTRADTRGQRSMNERRGGGGGVCAGVTLSLHTHRLRLHGR